MDFFTFDDEYVRRLRDGDRATVEHYFQYFNFFLKRRLQGRVPSDDIDDVIQTVHARVFAYLGSGKEIRESNRFGAFVIRFSDNIVHERGRLHTTEVLDDVYAAEADLLGDLITAEEKARVHRTLDALKPREAEILRTIYLKDLDKDEICQRFHVDRNYLRVLVHRALEKFRDKYDDS
jgi:RNA polymerase sigma-70 factor, ECF subfamily